MKRASLLRRLQWFVFVLTAIWGPLLPGLPLPGITLYPVRIIVIMWLLWKMVRKISTEHALYVKKQPAYVALLLLTLCGFITMTWSCDVKTSLTSMIVYLTAALCLIISKVECENELSIQSACEAVYWNTILIAGIAIYESFTGKYMVASYDYYYSTYNMFGLFRPKAVFYNTNNLTVYFVTCLPIAMYAAEHFKFRRISKLLIVVLSIVGVLLTGSRTGIAALLLFAALYLYYMIYSAKRSRFILLVIVLSIAMFIVIYFSPTLVQSITGGRNIGEEDRLPIWGAAWEACKRYWFMGAGPGTSAYVKGSLGLPHNYLLELCLEFGIVGLLSFIAILRSSIVPRRMIHDDGGAMYLRSYIWMFLLCTICPSSMQGYYFLWIIFGICLAYKQID